MSEITRRITISELNSLIESKMFYLSTVETKSKRGILFGVLFHDRLFLTSEQKRGTVFYTAFYRKCLNYICGRYSSTFESASSVSALKAACAALRKGGVEVV